MRHHFTAAIIALGGVLGLSATQAFAGLERLAQDDVPESWFINFSAQLGSSGLTSSFDNIRAFIGAPVTYTINSQTYTITTPSKFEDISSGGGHKAIQDFSIFNPPAVSTWSQTTIDATPAGTLITANGNSYSNNGQILNFNLFFTGAQTDGTHFFLEFYSGSTFITGYEIKDILVPGTAHPDGFEQTNYSQSQAVPLPSTVWMGGLLLIGGTGGLMLRRRRTRQSLA